MTSTDSSMRQTVRIFAQLSGSSASRVQSVKLSYTLAVQGATAAAAAAPVQRFQGSTRRGSRPPPISHVLRNFTPTASDANTLASTECMETDYFFEQRQDLLIEVSGVAVESASVPLSRLMSLRGSAMPVCSSSGLVVSIAAVASANNANDAVQLQLAFSGVCGGGLFSSDVRFMTLSRVMPNGLVKAIWRSPKVKIAKDGSLRFPPLPKHIKADDLAVSTTALPNTVAPLVITVHCDGTFGESVLASAHVFWSDLVANAQGSHPGPRMTLRKAGKTKTYGTVVAQYAEVIARPSFVDFLMAGQEINVAVAIDFTASNGNPTQPSSLHYMNPRAPNQYVRAIMSVCDILMDYDSDKRVPVYGYGALLPGANRVNDFFPVPAVSNSAALRTFDATVEGGAECAYVDGVQGVLDAYSSALPHVRLHGPTNFAPTIRQVHKQAESTPNVYTILLIITDGEISDLEATIDALVACDRSPLSVIIVGVGSGCDFQMMEVLDGDDVRITNRSGHRSLRDLVQFVPFRDFEQQPPASLAAEVLREVPTQLEEWSQLRGVVPPGWQGKHFDEVAAAGAQSPAPQAACAPAAMGGY